ncbi:MAG TPA: hypothetical protein VGF49_16130 [Candidatus Solibacter sp.]
MTRLSICAIVLGTFAASRGHAQGYASNLPVEHPSIRYPLGPVEDPVSRLARALETGSRRLPYREGAGYLAGLLDALGISPDSQALVFSKTSFQASKISPRNPRAIYFNDDVAVGWVRGGDGMEIAGLDPKQGLIFYTLDTLAVPAPRIVRRQECLHCHQGPATLGVPGIFVGSVFPDVSGMPYRESAIITDHSTAFADRWGGWYVNAARGQQRDRANAVAADPAEPMTLATDGNQNLRSLAARFDAAGYLSPLSDIVALMTFEHQTKMTNLLIRAGWEWRIKGETDVAPVADYMLFGGEALLREPVEGVSTFTQSFAQRGPRDRRGRGLRQFDLQTRLFRYPLSYMIYSPAFDALPQPVRDQLYRRLFDILSGKEGAGRYPHLGKEARRAILEIVRETKSGLPNYWRPSED